MSVENKEVTERAQEALASDKELASLLDDVCGNSRRSRQNAAAVLNVVAKEDISRLADHADVFIEALNLPEARTRWESLDILTRIVPINSRACDKAVEGADTALFDEDSGPLRLSAMRFLCKLGSTTPKRSERIWPLIDEGIQCYHGDLEFNDMLQSLVDFSNGSLAPEVKAAFKERMAFDAEHGKGSIKHYAETIIANLG